MNNFEWVKIHDFRIDGIPKAQPRARSRGKAPGVYDPGTAEGWKALVCAAFARIRPDEPFDQPLKVDVDWYFPRPRTFNKRTRAAYGGKSRDVPKGIVLHTSKPDRDNCDKAVLDALTNLGFMRDDALVCDGLLRKFYHAEGGRPGARVRVSLWRLEGRPA